MSARGSSVPSPSHGGVVHPVPRAMLGPLRFVPLPRCVTEHARPFHVAIPKGHGDKTAPTPPPAVAGRGNCGTGREGRFESVVRGQ